MARPWIRWLRWIAIGLAVVVAALALLWAVWWLWLRLSPPSDIRTVIAIAIAALALLAGIWWLWWRLPRRQVARLALTTPKARADVEDNFRKAVGQAIGGAAVLIGAGMAYLQFTQQQQASHDLLISNQVAKGFEQLAAKDNLTMRLGGIYALEGVMNTSAQYHQPVLEALCAFVREGTMGKTVSDRPATDIQAALTVIGRRANGPGSVDLRNANIAGASLQEADLSYANLTDANLSHTDLLRADLRGSDLSGADLSGDHWILDRATNLSGANLHGAILFHANLSNALLSGNLSGVVLAGANLSGVRLASDLNLADADLSFADLTGSKLDDQSQAILDRACGTKTRLPAGFTLKPCPQWLHSPLNQKTTPPP
jgi:uncharacterized protein YjbI with pentapeptide repeats